MNNHGKPKYKIGNNGDKEYEEDGDNQDYGWKSCKDKNKRNFVMCPS